MNICVTYILLTGTKDKNTKQNKSKLTSSAGAATICPAPLPSVGAEAPRAAEPTAPADVAVVPTVNTLLRSPLQLPDALTPRLVKRPGDLESRPFDLESGVRVM